MSIHHVECAALTALPASTKLVLMSFADSADKDTRVAFPGLGNVMAWSGLRKSRALEVTSWLTKQGYLYRVAGGKRGKRAEYLVFPAGCCPMHGRLTGYAGPDPLTLDGPATPDPNHEKGSDTADVDNSNGSGMPDVENPTGSDAADAMSPHGSDLRSNGSDSDSEWVRSGPDPSPPPPSIPPPPPARADPADPVEHGADGGGGGETQRVFDGLGSAWTISPSQRERLRPLVAAALRNGWPTGTLVTELASNPAGVRNPYAVLRNRLDDLPPPPHGSQTRTEAPEWCGECESPTRRFRERADGRLERCPRCHPLIAESEQAATT